MHKIKRNARERRHNKENLPSLNAGGDQRRMMERGAQDRLNELSDVPQQLVTLNPRKLNMADLSPWFKDAEDVNKLKASTDLKAIKKNSSTMIPTQSKALLRKRQASLNARSMSIRKPALTQQSYIPKVQTQPDQRISSILKSIYNQHSNLFPQSILKQTDRSTNYIPWKNPRLSLPTNLLKTTRSSHIKVYPSYDKSRTNFNKMILKCKQSTLYLKNPPKQPEEADIIRYIGEHAVFVKCRERPKIQFR